MGNLLLPQHNPFHNQPTIFLQKYFYQCFTATTITFKRILQSFYQTKEIEKIIQLLEDTYWGHPYLRDLFTCSLYFIVILDIRPLCQLSLCQLMGSPRSIPGPLTSHLINHYYFKFSSRPSRDVSNLSCNFLICCNKLLLYFLLL